MTAPNQASSGSTPKEKGEKRFPGIFAGALALLALLGLFCLFRFSFFLGFGLILLAAAVALRFLPFKLDPLTRRKVNRFRQIKRGFYAWAALALLTWLSLFAELFVNNRALIVSYEGDWYFPTYSRVFLGSEFGLEGVSATTPVDYRALDREWEEAGSDNWVLMPVIPYGPNQQTTYEGHLKPRPPDAESQHYLGTDTTGRDILARLIYGFRIAILFAVAFMTLTYLIGITIGCLMGFFGGAVDLLGQRLIEIWTNIPFLYMVIIVFSVIPTAFSVPTRIGILLIIMVLFSWTGMTYYMRTATYREKSRDYSAAAQVLGAGPGRIIFSHILPNTVSTIVTFMPFTVVSAITAITALDFLGFGMPPPTPSMGELLKQGRDNLTTAPWILSSAFAALVFLLTMVTFVGEAVREAFDPKKFTVYK